MQGGSLIRNNRKQGPDVWQFRWQEKGPHGKRVYRKRVIGTVEQYSDADAARRAVTGLVSEINTGDLRMTSNWVFASKRHRGRKPYWGQAILRRYVRPAAQKIGIQKIGIQKRIGWHTFRHTYSTLPRSVGTEFKVMQELLRHSSMRSTLDIYTQAITPAKQAAQGAVLSLVFSPEANGASRAEAPALATT
jgi:integrase